MTQEQDAKYLTPGREPASAEPEKNAKANQVLKAALTLVDKIQRQPIIVHLTRAAEQSNDRMGNQFGAAITYLSFLSMTPILMVSSAAAGFILASHLTLLQDIFNKILLNASDPTLVSTLRNIINTAVQQRITVGLVGPGIALYSGTNWMGNLREVIRAQSQDVWERAPQDQEKVWVKYLRDFIPLIGLLVALIVVLSITSIAGSAQQMIISALYLDGIERLKPAQRLIGLTTSIFANYLLFFWIFWRSPRHQLCKKALIRGISIAVLGSETTKMIMTYTLPLLVQSSSDAAFGFVFGLMAFSYLFVRLTLLCAAWIVIAEYRDDPRMPGKTHRQFIIYDGWRYADPAYGRVLQAGSAQPSDNYNAVCSY